MTDSFWRNVFIVSAIFNFLVGASMFFDLTTFAKAQGLEAIPYSPLFSPIIGWFVIVFGLMYLALSQELQNKTIALLGLTGKLGIVILVWFAYASGLAPLTMALLTLIDLLFAILFAVFLFVPK